MTQIDMPKWTREEGGASTLYNPIPGSRGMLGVGKIVFFREEHTNWLYIVNEKGAIDLKEKKRVYERLWRKGREKY